MKPATPAEQHKAAIPAPIRSPDSAHSKTSNSSATPLMAPTSTSPPSQSPSAAGRSPSSADEASKQPQPTPVGAIPASGGKAFPYVRGSLESLREQRNRDRQQQQQLSPRGVCVCVCVCVCRNAIYVLSVMLRPAKSDHHSGCVFRGWLRRLQHGRQLARHGQSETPSHCCGCISIQGGPSRC